MTAAVIFQDWDTPNNRAYGVADFLRSVAMICQDDHPEITRQDYVNAAEALGFNGSTAGRCWNFVKAQ